MNKREKYVQSLRAAADFLEAHPEVPVPFQQQLGWWCSEIPFGDGEPTGSDGVKALVQAAPHVTKRYEDKDLWVTYDLGSISLNYGCKRDAVCERVVTGTRVIPAEPERVVEVLEWRCKPLLAEV